MFHLSHHFRHVLYCNKQVALLKVILSSLCFVLLYVWRRDCEFT